MARPLHEQIVVITGASSGIGRATAFRMAGAGAKVVLASRNEVALNTVADEIRQGGGEALVVVTDVTDWEQMTRLAATAVETYGRIDTWVNNAGVGVYATAEETTPEEADQTMRTNFLGVVHGVKAALPFMKLEGAGTIINIGSVESQRALPYHSIYAASKHAVKAFTETLRMELQHANTGINVTLIMPSAINTPFFNHARSKMGVMPQPVPPAYKPELVAEAIAYAAEHPQRDMYIGGAGMLFALMERFSPALTDRFMMMGDLMFKLQKSNKPDNGVDAVFETMPESGRIKGDFDYLVKPSMYTRLFELTPAWIRNLALFGMIVGVGVVRMVTRR
jgi:NADP-dependent 3-hydroxy acid dehydrogenase YdfG